MSKNPFLALGSDPVKLIKQDGNTIEIKEALVQPKHIHVFDVSICIDEGDIITRELPNKKVESYKVINIIYEKGKGPIPPFYSLEVEKMTALPKTKTPSVNIINNIKASDGSKVLVSSVDNSVNISSQDLSVFDELIEAVKKIQNSNEMIAKIEQMKASVNDKKTFGQKYGEFIQLAAAHATLLLPLKPLISKLTDYLF